MGFTVLPEKRPLQHCFSLVFEELKMKAKYEGQVSMPRQSWQMAIIPLED